jgi:hypothetical protein
MRGWVQIPKEGTAVNYFLICILAFQAQLHCLIFFGWDLFIIIKQTAKAKNKDLLIDI